MKINICVSFWYIILPVHIRNRFKNIVVYHIEAETNGRHLPDDIFKCNFLNENVLLSIKISLKFGPKGQSSNIPALV